MSKDWKLTWGTHRGTLISRDVGDPITGLASRDACLAEVVRLRRDFARIGCSVWYATAHSPDGEQEQLFSTPYAR